MGSGDEEVGEIVSGEVVASSIDGAEVFETASYAHDLMTLLVSKSVEEDRRAAVEGEEAGAPAPFRWMA